MTTLAITPRTTTTTRPDGLVVTEYEKPGDWAARVIARSIAELNVIAEAHGAPPMCADRGVTLTPRMRTRGDGVLRGARMIESVARDACGFQGRTVLWAAEEIHRGIYGGAYSGPLKEFWDRVARGAMLSLGHY